VKKTHDYIHHYRGYWSDGGRCRIRIYHEDGRVPVVICSQLPDNDNTSVTNMAEYLAAEVMESHPDIFDPFGLGNIPGISYDKPFVWIEHYQTGARGSRSDPATFDLTTFEHYEPKDVRSGGVWRNVIGEPSWKALGRATVEVLVGGKVYGERYS
jgi:hypothetical protein